MERTTLRPADVARRLGISKRTVLQWLKDGRLRHSRVEGSNIILIPVGEVDRFLERTTAPNLEDVVR